MPELRVRECVCDSFKSHNVKIMMERYYETISGYSDRKFSSIFMPSSVKMLSG